MSELFDEHVNDTLSRSAADNFKKKAELEISHNKGRERFSVGQKVRIISHMYEGGHHFPAFSKVLPITEIRMTGDHPRYVVGTKEDSNGAFGYICCACDIEAA